MFSPGDVTATQNKTNSLNRVGQRNLLKTPVFMIALMEGDLFASRQRAGLQP